MLQFHYFHDCQLSRGFVALYSGRMIQYVANGLIGLFVPIYLLITYGKFEYVIYFFIFGHAAYAVLLPWGAQFLNKIGLRRSIHISVLFFALYNIFLSILPSGVLLYSALALLFLTIARLLFWLPYHTDVAKFTDLKNRGRGISLMWATQTFLSVIMPLLSGVLIKFYGYSEVFVIAIIVYLCSLIPYMSLPHTEEKFSWNYGKTVKEFFARKNQKLVLANMANGAENEISLVVWPIFIWQILKGNYVAVGAISSLIVFATVILQLSAGKLTDKINKRKIIHWGSVLYASGWLAKIFVLTSMQIFVVGTYHSFAQIFKDTPFDTLNYELLADRGHYVDEYTVIKEMAVQLGKVLILLFALAVALNFSLSWTFALAAMASLFINLL